MVLGIVCLILAFVNLYYFLARGHLIVSIVAFVWAGFVGVFAILRHLKHLRKGVYDGAFTHRKNGGVGGARM